MKSPDAFRDPAAAAALARAIEDLADRPVTLMEVCGTHTVAIFKSGLRDLLPDRVSLVSGPGCPVCVTPVVDVDRAIATARIPGVLYATFGDMMRVPGSTSSLQEVRALGADVRVVYSALDALALARAHPEREVILFAAGFETTAPTVAATLLQAEQEGVRNFSLHTVHKVIPPALRALLDAPEVKLDGLICPGHVSALIGSEVYAFIPAEFGRPAVISGFEPIDILLSVRLILEQLAGAAPKVEIEYSRVVAPEGNRRAMGILNTVFEPSDAEWRGIGTIPGSGLALREPFAHRDALRRFEVEVQPESRNGACECGEILRGLKTPADCRLFAKACTPESPVGACMVSSEGSCAAYYTYARS